MFQAFYDNQMQVVYELFRLARPPLQRFRPWN